MNRKIAGYAAATISASLVFGSLSTTYGAPLTLAGFGADKETAVVTQKETEVQTEAVQAEVTQTEAAAAAEAIQVEVTQAPQTEAAAPETEAQTEAPLDTSMVGTTGFVKADDVVNVRSAGYVESDPVGSLSANDSVEILGVDADGWYHIRSGNVEGYVAGYLVATGAEADEISQNAGYTYAEVGAETLNIRASASADAEVLDTVPEGAELEVVEQLDGWNKVVTPDGIYGYASTDYTCTQTVYSTGETIQEQSEREEQEYLEAVAQQEAEWAAYVAESEAQAAVYDTSDDGNTYDDNTYTEETYSENSGNTDGSGYSDTQTTAEVSTELDALYQAYLTAQENAMTCTDEADATAKANAAIEAYNAYMAAAGSTETVATIDSSTTDSGTTDSSTTGESAASTENTYTETVEETPQTEAPAAEETASVSSSYSSTGSSVAAYACQFVGNPYVYGGTSLTNGCDCSGFTMSVYANFGVSLPHNAAAQSGCGTQVSLSSLQPGDLLFYGDGGIGHVALYVGNGTVVHASNEETGIKYSSYNYRTPVCAVRLV